MIYELYENVWPMCEYYIYFEVTVFLLWFVFQFGYNSYKHVKDYGDVFDMNAFFENCRDS